MNLMKFLFTLGLSIIIFASCQKESNSNYPEYYRKYNEVLRLEKEEKMKDALELFQQAEKLIDFVPVQHLIKGRSLAIKNENCDLVQEYFQKAVHNGFEYSSFEFSSNLCPNITNASIKGIAFDEEYKNAVELIFQLDQDVRHSFDKSKMRRIDSTNIEKLLSLINDKGYPSSKLIGERSANRAFIVLLHFDSDIGNKKLKPIIEKAYHEGKISPENYAWIIDRRLNWGPEKLDPYYYQIPTGKYFELSATEIAIVDERRLSIGMKPLAEMNVTKNEDGSISIQL